MKKCIKCGQNKELKEYHKRTDVNNGYDGRCKKCSSLYHKEHYQKNILVERKKRRERDIIFRKNNPDASREHKLKMRYGITLKDKEEMLKNQGGLCLICKIDIKNKACVDHNHKTDKIRSLLCDGCNTGIGMFKENIETMKKAIQYLKKWNRLDMEKIV